MQNPDGAQAEDDEEYDEIDEDDRDRFADQLKAVGVLGRMVADHTVPLVGRCVVSQSKAFGPKQD